MTYQKNEHWKSTNGLLINELKIKLKQSDVTLVLGSGVSRSAGLPDWKGLLEKLVQSQGDDECPNNRDFEKLYDSLSHSSIRMASYIEQLHFKDDSKAMIRRMREILYEKGTDLQSPLTRQICSLIEKYNQQVRSVITYNYDNLIERGLDNLGLEYLTVYQNNRQDDRHKLPIYHVHGHIAPNNSEMENVSDIVFTESSYHEKYTNVYHWSSVEQLHAFERNTCLFIGLSMDDPNMRRLLEIASRNAEELYHYAILLRPKENKQSGVGCADDITIRERLLQSFGINIIWYEDETHEEVVDILHGLCTDINEEIILDKE